MARMESLNTTYPKLDKDSEGWWLCRYCRERITKTGRYRAWCSPKCVKNAEERTYSNRARTALFKRQNGICQLCGVDTQCLDHELRVLLGLSRDLYHLFPHQRHLYHSILITLLTVMKRIGFSTNPTMLSFRSLWQCDHIVEYAEGGTLDPTNLQTLCIPCHKRKTKKYVGIK